MKGEKGYIDPVYALILLVVLVVVVILLFKLMAHV